MSTLDPANAWGDKVKRSRDIVEVVQRVGR
jgi:hypothetical protein